MRTCTGPTDNLSVPFAIVANKSKPCTVVYLCRLYSAVIVIRFAFYSRLIRE